MGRRRPPTREARPRKAPLMERFLYALGTAACFAALIFAIYRGTN